MRTIALSAFGALMLAGCSQIPINSATTAPTAQPVEARPATAAELLARMSLEHKVAQLIMPDISTITPADVRTYRFGSILNGGNSGPGGDDKAPAPEWLALADAFWEASTAPLPGGGEAVPLLWATDAVHGHANVPGATIFPHNIGLGATRNPELMRQIGEATAIEIAVTGIDWTFAPSLAVATDDRWGRTYESFAENPALVSDLGAAIIRGLQGDPASPDFLSERHVIATAKHFFGDGGTGGLDRGDTRGDLAELQRIHGSPYIPAIAANVQSVMASFSSVNGVKMHGNGPLLDGYLRDGLGFGGLVVGDWNGHGELAMCTNSDCPESLLAGLDIYMVPEDWRALYESLLAQVRDGTIPMARLDEAVTRILEVKLAYGLFDKPRPSERAVAGDWSLLGAPAHRDLAREAVRQSLVLLRNDGVLPIAASANVLVAGAAADDIAWQSGGWSITWQGGGDLTNADFPGATSIYAGIAEAMAASGGEATLSATGEFSERPDLAIVVFGEKPYAEFVGDLEDLILRDTEGLDLLRRFDAEGIPTVAVFLSGRPLWMNREMALADAFVAAWLPGSEGAGLADVLIGDAAGGARHDFTGQLSFGWPANCAPDGSVLFPYGTTASYAAPTPPMHLSQQCGLLDANRAGQLRIFGRGLNSQVTAVAEDASGAAALPNLVGASTGSGLQVTAFDYQAQEDARKLEWSTDASLALQLPDGFRAAAGGSLVLTYSLDQLPAAPIVLTGERAIDVTSTFTLGTQKGWRSARIPLICLADTDLRELTLQAGLGFVLSISQIAISPESFSASCEGPF